MELIKLVVAASDLVLIKQKVSVTLVYVDATQGWINTVDSIQEIDHKVLDKMLSELPQVEL